jgi:hypothetical protein
VPGAGEPGDPMIIFAIVAVLCVVVFVTMLRRNRRTQDD